jgi:N-methylhydantoinase A/oxoprolinase/acetone carboxylase beta subunit
MSRDGVVLRPLDPDEGRREIAELAEAIAVCFLHSNRAHERAVHSNSWYG